MMRRRRFFLAGAGAAVIAAVAVLIGATVSLGSPDSALKWSVFGSSGNSSSSTNYKLGSTSGQSSPIGASQSTNYKLGAGFWYGAGDSDGDGCPDINEQQTDVGSEVTGGRRDYLNPWDYFNPSLDGINRTDDITLGVLHYGHDASPPGDPLYSTRYDRSSLMGGNPWQFDAPDGIIRTFEITAAVLSYGHDCS